ncbi:MAG: FAD linked oxidase domain protein [Bacteroidetes bacterium]|nr:MAG: FAD linked oxidase domain protein [Bacteroidota bacterium]
MKNKLTRRDFIRIGALGGGGLLLAACGSSGEEPKQQKTGSPAPAKDSVPAVNATAAAGEQNVTFIKKGDPLYDPLRQGFNKNVDKYPLVIALCKSTADVAEAIRYAAENKLAVAVKSGGHSVEGFSCNTGGMVVNLSQLNGIEWLDEETVKIGPGCTLSKLYDELLPEKRIIPAGSCGTVGIGGLATGGGYGFFGRKYGLTCDSLMKVTLVDGQGKIHDSDNEPELLWACRGGGGGNFGVVTEMVFKTYPAPETFTSHRFKSAGLDAARANTLLEKWMEVAVILPDSCYSAFVLNGKSLTILLTNYEKHTPQVQSVFDALAAVSDKATAGNPVTLSKALKNYYGYDKPIYFKISSAGVYKDYEEIRPFAAELLAIVTQSPGMIYQLGTIGGKISDAELEKNSCFPHRAKPFLSELQIYWENAGGGQNQLAKFNSVQQLVKENNMTAHYVNYANLDFEDPGHAYYGKNYERLQQVKKKYDPENTIRHGQSVKPV